MRTRQLRQAAVAAVSTAIPILVLATVPAVFPPPARAAVTCPSTATTDLDGDGFADAEECGGIKIPGTNLPIPTCTPGVTLCLDPNKKDVFLLVVPTTPSLLPTNPAEFISNAPPGGLGLAPHIVDGTQVDPGTRAVTATQKAIKMSESSETNTDRKSTRLNSSHLVISYAV